MFERCISFTVTFFPEDGRLTVDCLNSRDCFSINVIGVIGDTLGVSSAAA